MLQFAAKSGKVAAIVAAKSRKVVAKSGKVAAKSGKVAAIVAAIWAIMWESGYPFTGYLFLIVGSILRLL